MEVDKLEKAGKPPQAPTVGAIQHACSQAKSALEKAVKHAEHMVAQADNAKAKAVEAMAHYKQLQAQYSEAVRTLAEGAGVAGAGTSQPEATKPCINLTALLNGGDIDLDDEGLFGFSAEGIEVSPEQSDQLKQRKLQLLAIFRDAATNALSSVREQAAAVVEDQKAFKRTHGGKETADESGSGGSSHAW